MTEIVRLFFIRNDYRIGYLSQASALDEGLTVLQAVFQGNSPMIRVVREYEEALIALAANGDDPAIQKRYSKAEEQMNKEDAWTTDTNAKIILQKLGISELEKKIGELSGGQKKRVSLASSINR